jgi:hypothetical protein
VRSPRAKTAVLHPDADPQAAELAKTYGVGEMEFGRKSASSIELQRITFGLALVSEDGAQVFSRRHRHPVSRIRNHVAPQAHRHGPAQGCLHARSRRVSRKAGRSSRRLDRLFAAVQEFEFTPLKGDIPPDAAALVVAGPIREFSDEKWAQQRRS